MALTICKECSHKVSTTAPACPNCGAPDFILKNIRWRKGYCPGLIAKRLDNSANRRDSNVVSFNAFESGICQSVLYSMLEFKPPYSIPESHVKRIIWGAACQAGDKGEITADSLLVEIISLSDKYMALPLEPYVLATSLSISSSVSLPMLSFQDQENPADIIFESSLPREYREAAEPIIAKAENVHSALYLKEYLSTRVQISARSDTEAAEEALNLLAWLRGIWNLKCNMRTLTSMSYTDDPLIKKPPPVNQIVIAPIHTLHRPDGELIPGKYWYENRYHAARKTYRPSPQDITDMYNILKSARSDLAASKYPEKLRKAIIRYARALDEWDCYNAFLGLWSVLESLTRAHQDNYDAMVNRASFLFEDRKLYREIMKHLRNLRNSIVHDSAETDEMRTHVYQLKLFVEQAILFHLHHRFTNLKEAQRFLDLPDRKNKLNQEIELRKTALEYLQYT